MQLPFISSSTPNGNDPQTGNAITGFKWWNFTYPTIVDSGTNAITDFDNATTGSVNFGGTWARCRPRAKPTQRGTIQPLRVAGPLPRAVTVIPTTIPWARRQRRTARQLHRQPSRRNASCARQSQHHVSGRPRLVYQVDLGQWRADRHPGREYHHVGTEHAVEQPGDGTPVKVYGIPQANGTIKCYVLTYFTGFAQRHQLTRNFPPWNNGAVSKGNLRAALLLFAGLGCLTQASMRKDSS